MAVQMHVAHSARIKGVGALAGGPYYCAQGSLWTAYYNCMKPGAFMPLPSLATLKSATERLAAAGSIDPTANLALARAWLFTGTRDDTVAPEVVEELQAFYAAYKTATVLVRDKPAGNAVNDTFAREAGYNRWADANRIIVLYPQAIARWWWVYNPNGCWDWWGYTGAHYHTRDGAQVRAVMAMLSRLCEPRK